MNDRAPVLPGLDIRLLTLHDVDAGAGLARSRGWAYEPERWRFTLEVGQGWGAFDADGALVASVQLTGCTPDVAAIGSMLVAAPLERQGLGSHLLSRALDAAGDRIVTLAATRAGRPLYERFGFDAVGELAMYRGNASGVAGAPSGPTRPATPADLPAMVALDTLAHGGDRTPLLTALPGLATAVRVLPDRAGGLRAFAAAWPSDGRQMLGPVVAMDDAGAVAVLEAVVGDVSGPVRVDVHAAGDAGGELAAWARRSGFERFAHATIMVCGGASGVRGLPGRGELVRSPIMQSMT